MSWFRNHRWKKLSIARIFGLGLTLFTATSSHAALIDLTITVRNLSPANSTSFAPLRFGVGNGTFDSFNNGSVAGPGIVSIAEGGGGQTWFSDFAAADPNSVRGTVGGALIPVGSPGNGNFASAATSTFAIDTAVNRFFTFGAMVVPSNDLFVGPDQPDAFQIFDTNGSLLINRISQTAAQIWNAGSEAADPANAAFVVGGVNSQRTPENGVVSFSRTELGAINGLTTPAGYVFSDASLTGSTEIYEITFSATPTAVPEPSSMALLSLVGGGVTLVRRRRSRAKATSEAQALLRK